MLINDLILIYLITHLLISITCFLIFSDCLNDQRYNRFVTNNLATVAILSLLAPYLILLFAAAVVVDMFLENLHYRTNKKN